MKRFCGMPFLIKKSTLREVSASDFLNVFAVHIAPFEHENIQKRGRCGRCVQLILEAEWA